MSFYLNYKDTNYWGPIYWNILHNLAKKVDESENEEDTSNFFSILKNFTSLIPCDDCSSTYINTLKQALQILNVCKVIKRFYFQHLLYYLHLCVTIKKEEENNLVLFMDNFKKTANVKKSYYNIFKKQATSIEELVYLKPIDVHAFETYYTKHMIDKGDKSIYKSMMDLIEKLHYSAALNPMKYRP